MKEDKHVPNIFETAAQQSKKEKHPPPTPPPPKKEEKIKETAPPSSEEDVDAMLERMRVMHKELQDKAGDIYDTTRLKPNQLHQFLNKMGGQQWEKNQKDRKKLEDQVFSVLGEQERIKAKKDELDKSSKARKVKTIGARKKNWLPMQ